MPNRYLFKNHFLLLHMHLGAGFKSVPSPTHPPKKEEEEEEKNIVEPCPNTVATLYFSMLVYVQPKLSVAVINHIIEKLQ